MRPGLGNTLRFPCPRSEEPENISRLSTSAARVGQLHHSGNPESTSSRGDHALDLSAGGKASARGQLSKQQSAGCPFCPFRTPPQKKSCSVFSHDHTAFYTILSGTGYIHTQCISHATASGDQGYALFEYYPVGTPETVEHNETSFLMETQPTELQIFSFSRHRFVFPLSFLIPENNQG